MGGTFPPIVAVEYFLAKFKDALDNADHKRAIWYSNIAVCNVNLGIAISSATMPFYFTADYCKNDKVEYFINL
ncbi:hypothetical protein T03_13279 [Trichinella britovi]|uniref:Uncharacterized protein n=1 Tax=Trichinella britovi TaxID=45882 RepID=A0A0V1CBJ0_TRIBR|nr:hypothetical protein T03_13279 [Trichinella britovi]